MVTTSLEDTSAPWAKIAEQWLKYFTPPSRPSKLEVDRYRQWINTYLKPNQKALVLGATPELLDILAEINIAVDLIDINDTMVKAMIAITKQPDTKRNITIANWLKMPYPNKTYDFVLGDAVVPNVPYETREDFMKEVKRVMKPDALFLNRAFCVPAKKPYATIDEVLLHFRDKPANETTAIELVLEIQILTYNSADHLGSMPKVRAEVMKLREDNGFHRLNQKENELLDILWNYWLKDISDKVWVYDTKDNEEKLYKNYFQILEAFTTGDQPYGEITPLYLLKNKS